MPNADGRMKVAGSWCPVGAVGLLLVLVFVLAWYHFVQYRVSFNSDHLYCLHFCDDVLHGRDVRGWHLPAAPYLFPDMAILSGLALFTSNIAVLFSLYSAVHYLLTLAILVSIFRLVGLSWRQGFTAAALGLMLLLAVSWHPEYINRNLLLLHPGSHLSCQLVGLAATALVLRALLKGYHVFTAILLVGICGLSGFSDQLLLVQYLAPISAAALLLGVCRVVSLRRALLTAFLLGIAMVLAMTKQSVLTQLGLVPMNCQPAYRWVGRHAIREFLATFWNTFHQQPLMLLALSIHLAGALAALLYRMRGAQAADAQDPTGRKAILFVALVLLLAPLSNAAALMVTNMVNHSTLDRYLYTWLLLPFLFLALWPHLLPWRPAARLLSAAMLLLVAFRLLTFPEPISLERFSPRYPPLAQALDELVRKHGRLRGFAEYWRAREMHYLTREHVEIVPIVAWGRPWFHGFNPNAFLGQDRHDLSIPDYHFLIMSADGEDGPVREHIVAYFGTPVEIIPVEHHEIWRYERLENRQLDLFWRAQLAQRLVEQRPFTAPVEPSALARPKRNLTPWDARGNVPLQREQTLSIRFAKPVTGRMIDLAANYADEYQLRFLRQGRELGKMRVPSVEWNGAESAYCEPGLQSRLVAVPDSCRDGGFDEVCVTPFGRSQHFALGHFLVFDDWIPYRSGRGRPSEKYHRYEGEKLARHDVPEVMTLADPSASAGQVRQASDTFQGCLAYGPYVPLAPGRYRVDFAVKIEDNTTTDPVLLLDAVAFAGQQCLQQSSLTGVDFPRANQYQVCSLSFDVEDDLDLVEYRVMVLGKTKVTLDYVDVTCLEPEKASEACEP